jgi:septum formation protein
MMADTEARLVLASASPRRLALIEQVGIFPDLLNPVDIDETPQKRESPRGLSLRLAREKAQAARSSALVRNLGDNVYILAADTVVCVGRRVVDKPQSADEAREALLLLSGRSHRVFTSIAVVSPDGREKSRVVDTKVRFKRLARADIDAYLLSDEWRGKAGGYAIQGKAAAFVRFMSGSYTCVVGLPLHESVQMLQAAGYPVYAHWTPEV